MKTYSVQELFTIGPKTGLRFNYDGNAYTITDIDEVEQKALNRIIIGNYPIDYIRVKDDGTVRLRTPSVSDDNPNPTLFVDFQVELTDGHVIESQRDLLKSEQAIHSFSDEIIHFVNRLSIERYGLITVANWQDGGSDANVIDIHTPEAFMMEYPQARRDEVESLFEGRRDGFPIRTWVDDNDRIVCDSVYFVGDIEKDTETPKDLFYIIEDNKHALELTLAIKHI